MLDKAFTQIPSSPLYLCQAESWCQHLGSFPTSSSSGVELKEDVKTCHPQWTGRNQDMSHADYQQGFCSKSYEAGSQAHVLVCMN